ncbi:MAG: hypothetical protein ABIH67_00755 [Candidatus Uhrbacteria bacterium]
MDSAHHMGWYLLDRAAAEILVDQRPEMSIGSILEPLQQCRDEITYVWMLASNSNGRAIIKTRVHAELPEDENVWLAFRTS